jgi:hypothetical protein
VEERRQGEMYARSLTHGEVRRWVHGMRVNGPPKFGPKSRRCVASFCHLSFCYESVSNMF